MTDVLVGHRPLSPGHKARALSADRADCLRLSVQFAVASPGTGEQRLTDEQLHDAVHTAMKMAHDLVVEHTGRGRLTAVSWRFLTGTEALAFAEQLAAGEDQDARPGQSTATLAETLDALRTVDGAVMVVATAMADTRAAKAHLS
ncbi:MAG: hypothetical protein QOJ92_265 [Frankiales bacterium]|nr:hypothetical protein [Frankiales bacterium]